MPDAVDRVLRLEHVGHRGIVDNDRGLQRLVAKQGQILVSDHHDPHNNHPQPPAHMRESRPGDRGREGRETDDRTDGQTGTCTEMQRGRKSQKCSTD